MTELLIGRVTASSTAADEPRVRRLLTAVTERRLDQALAGLTLPTGEWCIDRLAVPLRLSARLTDGAVEQDWAQALAIALRDALESGSVVHYPRPLAALTELLVGLALGRTERLWAWRQLGLSQPGDPDPVGVPAAATLAALRRRPAEAMPALIAALPLAGLPALHRLFGPAGWNELARLVIAGLAGDPALAIPPEQPAESRSAMPGLTDRSDARAELQLIPGIEARSTLHRAVLRGRLRPDRVTAWAWAGLVVAEVEPVRYSRPAVRATLSRLADGYQTAGGSASGPTSRQSRSIARLMPESTALPKAIPFSQQWAETGRLNPQTAVAGPGECASPISSDITSDSDETSAARRPGPVSARSDPEFTSPIEESWPTAWGGLPFFLNTAGPAGLPDALLDDAVLAERPMGWLLYQLGRLLVPVIDPFDPALFALAGQLPAPVLPAEPSRAEVARLAEHADRWQRLTVARLDRFDEPAEDVATDLAARPGRVCGQPGWIEIQLSLNDVRLDVRRAGLDLDPGWLRWLGAVVSFRYE